MIFDNVSIYPLKSTSKGFHHDEEEDEAAAAEGAAAEGAETRRRPIRSWLANSSWHSVYPIPTPTPVEKITGQARPAERTVRS